MTEERGPSLWEHAAGRLRRLPGPKSYAPAFALLAAIPAVTALIASGLALSDDYGAAALRRVQAPRFAAIATVRRNARARAAIASYIAARTLTADLEAVARLLPPDATLHAIERRADGTTRIEVDCTDPDALRRAFRPPAAPMAWRSVAQSVAEDAGVRVTLEAVLR